MKTGSEFNNKFMQVALQYAKLAYIAGEIPVGCVIVNQDSGKIIARSHNIMQQAKNANLHAEIVAINLACKKMDSKNLSNCDLYVTLEPCTMCTSAISNARIRRLYYGATDTKQGAVESGVRFYTSSACLHRPELYSGLCSSESELLLKNFFNDLRKSQIKKY